MEQRKYDLCVIGAGVNGAGIARDAAGRGLSVVLIDAGDIAGMTSSSSSKMLHGGLRYLENFEFSLVREALYERKAIMQIAPHIARPMDFVLPHSSGQRPIWMIRVGLFLYDVLAGRKKIKSSRAIDIKAEGYGAVLKGNFERGFRYTDGQVDDARLVVLNAVSASEMGADVMTYTRCTHIQAEGSGWVLSVKGKLSGAVNTLRADTVINAAGPVANRVLELDHSEKRGNPAPGMRLVKGSHIVVDKLYDGDWGYLFQNEDKRVVFMWPFEGRYTLIGTTEEDYEGNPRDAKPSEVELDYLCAVVANVTEKQIKRDDIRFQFSGVLPLIDDGKANAGSVSRRHRFHEHVSEGGARMISIYGGKLTTYRLIAQEAVDLLVGRKKRWTARDPLPGGDVPEGDMARFEKEKLEQYSDFDADMVRRYVHSYGTRMDHILGVVGGVDGLGAHYGDHVYEAEIRYLIRREFARTSFDILWRRSKLVLHVSEQTKQNLEEALPDLLKDEGVEI